MLSKDLLDFFSALNESETRYLIVGGMAVVAYGVDRTTGDIDIWLSNDEANLNSLEKALLHLQFEPIEINAAIDAYRHKGKLTMVLDIKFPLELLPLFSSFTTFEDAYQKRRDIEFSGVLLKVVDLDTLMDMKIRAGREKDFWDVNQLKKKQKE